jgi:SAM-dependent methyltransferase
MKPIKTFSFFGYRLELHKPEKPTATLSTPSFLEDKTQGLKLHFGPGPHWKKPDDSWVCVDVDPALGDIVVNFQNLQTLPIPDDTVLCVYGSHVFEHISILKSQKVFNEIYRVLQKGGVFRLVLPDVEKSIKHYVNRNGDYKLFQRRRERAKERYGVEYTLFECLREDFLSCTGQKDLLGEYALAHQNAWDYETVVKDLNLAGFDKEKIRNMDFAASQAIFFSFEGSFPSEANEHYRSLYVEATK